MTRNNDANSAIGGRQLLQAAVFVVAVLAVFLVPFAFAPANGISMSYRVGFNNHAAIVTLLAMSLAFAVWTRGWGLRLGVATMPREPRRWRAIAAVAGLIALPGFLAVALWLRAAWSVPGNEANYFLDRYAMLDLGYVPYRTMTFDYGPLMFYPALWLRAALHLSASNGYFLSWVLQWVLGTALLWDTVRRLAAPLWHRVAVFAAMLFLLLPILYSGGVNYTPLRYLLAPWFALLVYRVQQRSVPRGVLSAFVGCCIAGLYSPEQGICLALATVLFFALCVRRRVVILPLLLFALAIAAALAVAKHFGLLQTMLDFGGGGYDFPLLLSTRTVAFIALLVLSGCVVVCGFFDGAPARPEIYLIAVTLGLLPSALGRADAGHLLVNTVPALAVTLLVLWRTPKVRLPAMVLTALLVAQVLATQVVPGFYRAFGPHLAAHARQMRHPPSGADTPAMAAERASLHDVLQAEGKATLFAPLGYPQAYPQSGPLPIATGRFFGFGLVSQRFVQAKIDEIEERRDSSLLLPSGFQGFCWTPDAAYTRGVLRDVLHPWYVPTVKHTGNAALPMCLYLRQHYKPAAMPFPMPGYVLVRRTDAFRSSR